MPSVTSLFLFCSLLLADATLPLVTRHVGADLCHIHVTLRNTWLDAKKNRRQIWQSLRRSMQPALA
ncbi:hypothetical protein THS27_19320 [Thalassospira sp. MCCC 1A01428]|nr:hypothetical protein THS27_19320 [Thalassospira sp. MCCC 1A01428]